VIRYTFSKCERLKREQHIETLFREGKAFSVFPLRVVWRLHPAGNLSVVSQTGFSVPKKKFRHAVDRNKVKRLLRESWRHQKHLLIGNVPTGQMVQLFFIYNINTHVDRASIDTAVAKCVQQLILKIKELPHY
jgi:ribonuclease P protein component